MGHKPIILLVEDSEADLEAIRRAFRAAGWAEPLAHCWTGDDALDYLHRRGPFAAPHAAPRPDLVLLDLNLPGTDGREVLAEVKTEDGLKTIPVIVLTTSGDARDVTRCYQAGANCYVQKPLRSQDLQETIRHIKEFWCETVQLPGTE